MDSKDPKQSLEELTREQQKGLAETKAKANKAIGEILDKNRQLKLKDVFGSEAGVRRARNEAAARARSDPESSQ